MLENSLEVLPVGRVPVDERMVLLCRIELEKWMVVAPLEREEKPDAGLRKRQIVPVRNACAPMKASLEVETLDTRSLIIDCYRPRNASDRIAVIICDVCGCKIILSDLEAQ